MAAYILRRLLLMIPTLIGIMIVNFVIVQFAPGGPVEKVIVIKPEYVKTQVANIVKNEDLSRYIL